MAQNYDNLYERLVIMLTRLCRGEELSVTALSHEFNVNERTVQRDFNDHLKYFTSVVQDKKKWKIQPNNELNDDEIKDTILLYLIKKCIGNSGKKFHMEAKYFLEKPMIQSDIIGPVKYNIEVDNVEDETDCRLESAELIEFHMTKCTISIMKRKNDPEKYLCNLGDDGYIIMNRLAKQVCKYQSVDELFQDGWRILHLEKMLKKLKIKYI